MFEKILKKIGSFSYSFRLNSLNAKGVGHLTPEKMHTANRERDQKTVRA